MRKMNNVKPNIRVSEKNKLKAVQDKMNKEIPDFIKERPSLFQMLNKNVGYFYWEGYGKYGERDYDER